MDLFSAEFYQRNYEELMAMLPEEYKYYIALALGGTVFLTIASHGLKKLFSVLHEVADLKAKFRKQNNLPNRKY